ncbi:NOL1/NOP2/sun family protein (macronuclear) [Tetrahymena thermophila SB210]|uniref:NOL1/NOP2/sun family protein n=1 Tax=Tetrahymena thermophila (strain SB210) TaxID=312017 RepID=I7M457_TETTS|nr:NOL1/NOP2/sun family protein [Tetrahymena thermophila SB210]EAS04949.1 NOL1/NOP2/sun family protein [Tetrahymena thermophila SB210]|eukprot:XP_001025194.1 NOL1/NOP2/sun family protein [Tetrahymena thermophila SB210]
MDPSQRTSENSLVQNEQKNEEQDKEQKNKNILDLLPSTFTQFLKDNNINLEYFQEIENFPRYIRLKPDIKVSIEELKKDLGTDDVQKIDYLCNFYSIPENVKIVNSKYYSQGLLYGIDLSSAAVIKSLDPQKGEKVLDLCCCPGMKLCNIADIIGAEGKAFGVDINETRLNTCRSIVKKYKLDHIIKLELADGTTYNKESQFDRVLVDAECTHDGSLKHLAKFIKNQKAVIEDMQNNAKETIDNNEQNLDKKQNNLDFKSSNNKDAENPSCQLDDDQVESLNQTADKQVEQNNTCNQEETNQSVDTLDSQIKENQKVPQLQKDKKQGTEKKISNRELKRRKKQIEKNNSNIYTQKKVKKNEWSMEDFQERVLDPIKLQNIVDLQKKLLTNGFKLCKEGGYIVYSTCSFARNQNEDVVEWFLNEFKDQVESIHPFNNDVSNMPACKPGFIQNTVRFDPFVSKSGGMFVSKFIKKQKQLQN